MQLEISERESVEKFDKEMKNMEKRIKVKIFIHNKIYHKAYLLIILPQPMEKKDRELEKKINKQMKDIKKMMKVNYLD